MTTQWLAANNVCFEKWNCSNWAAWQMVGIAVLSSRVIGQHDTHAATQSLYLFAGSGNGNLLSTSVASKEPSAGAAGTFLAFTAPPDNGAETKLICSSRAFASSFSGWSRT